MNKDFVTEVTPAATADTDMALINRFTRKKLGPDEVYTFQVLLCDNEIDRDFERFTVDALKTLAELFVGKTGIFDHSVSSRGQVARLYAAEVLTDSGRQTGTGEPYTFIKAKAYMARTPDNAGLIAEIDAGIKKEASVGCSVKRMTCSVCGADLKRERCGHVKGKNYGGQVCHTVLCEPADAYEWSFVAVPAQRNAGILKKFKNRKGEQETMETILKALRGTENEVTFSRQEADSLLAGIEALEKQAADGKAYREELTGEVLRMGLIALPQMGGESFSGICERLSVTELRELKKAFGTAAGKTVPLKPQLKGEEPKVPVNNDEFKI